MISKVIAALCYFVGWTLVAHAAWSIDPRLGQIILGAFAIYSGKNFVQNS